jgi:hypothetical protein
MIHTLNFYAGVLAVHKSPSPHVNELLQTMLDDMDRLVTENEAHERARQFMEPGLKIADDAVVHNYSAHSWAKDIDSKLRYMDKPERNWIIARPSLQKELGLRLIEKDGQPWLEAIPENVGDPDEGASAPTEAAGEATKASGTPEDNMPF